MANGNPGKPLFDPSERSERQLHRMEAAEGAVLTPFKLKAMAMKLRHRQRGVKFFKSSVESMKPLLTTSSSATNKSATVSEVEGPNNLLGLKMIFFHPVCIPLIAVPLGIMSEYLGWGDVLTFWLNFLALVPLAKILGDATEELAAAIQNDTISGLLNATFGNAVEMIVSVQSIRAGLFTVVKSSLLGSVLSNILLVLGTSFLLGGLTPSRSRCGRTYTYHGTRKGRFAMMLEKEQKFPVKAALINMGLLLFACMTFALPTLFDALPTDDSRGVLIVSRIGSWIAMSSYAALLLFQLFTHTSTLSEAETLETPAARRRPISSDITPSDVEGVGDEDEEDDDDEAAVASLTIGCAMMLMAATTLVVAVNSEFLVNTIEKVVAANHIPVSFIGVILLPIAGNACEHASAVRFAMQDRPGLSIGIAVGSSTQVALLVVPFSVVVASFLGKPLDLNYGELNVAVVTLSSLVVLVLLLDGRSNWLKGYIMVAMYVFIATLYWYVPPSFGGSNDSKHDIVH